MWFDGQRQPNTLYVANTSRGKDSTAMLRAIQLMGWPLDMICSVDIWFDESTPAELPPMVKFKDEYDRKVFEWFGVPVTRLCATKRSQICKVERERESRNQTETVTHKGCRSPHCSTAGCIQKKTDGTSKDSQTQIMHGASCSKTSSTADTVSKLTYKDIFYRKVLPKTGGAQGTSDFRTSERRPAPGHSNGTHLRIPDYGRQPRKLVYTPQTDPVKGFPWRKGAWCQDRLKGNF